MTQQPSAEELQRIADELSRKHQEAQEHEARSLTEEIMVYANTQHKPA